MIRADLYDFDGGLDEALDHLDTARTTLRTVRDRVFMLQAALDAVAAHGTADEIAGPGAHKHILADLNLFFEGLFALEACLAADPDYAHAELPHRPLRFVDAGCGTGRLVHLLRATDRMAFIDIHGFDLSETLIRLGRARFGLGEAIFVGDCLTFDYSSYDVVYFYRPIEDVDGQIAFEQRVIEQLRPGAYIFGLSARTLDEDRRLLMRHRSYGIYKRL